MRVVSIEVNCFALIFMSFVIDWLNIRHFMLADVPRGSQSPFSFLRTFRRAQKTPWILCGTPASRPKHLFPFADVPQRCQYLTAHSRNLRELCRRRPRVLILVRHIYHRLTFLSCFFCRFTLLRANPSCRKRRKAPLNKQQKDSRPSTAPS